MNAHELKYFSRFVDSRQTSYQLRHLSRSIVVVAVNPPILCETDIDDNDICHAIGQNFQTNLQVRLVLGGRR